LGDSKTHRFLRESPKEDTSSLRMQLEKPEVVLGTVGAVF